MILHTRGQPSGFQHTVLGRVTAEPVQPARRRDHILVVDDVAAVELDGYAGVFARHRLDEGELAHFLRLGVPVVHDPADGQSIQPDQVVMMDGRTGFVRILFRPESRFIFIFATDRCNSRCLMCSQPPRDVDDSERIHQHLRLVELMDPEVEYLGITGGEPTLLGNDLFRLLAACRDRLPNAHLHVLTNGRLFYYEEFAKKAAAVNHPRLTWAIPLYSDVQREHDYVVQARNAFAQTTAGFYALARHRQLIEIRVVLHALTYRRLPRLAEYLYRTFPFASHVAFMGLELMGYAKANLNVLWVDPYDYQDELEVAVHFLANRRIPVSIYNHQLCVLRPSLWPYARKAISDWKNAYLHECDSCSVRDQCGGFFASGLERHSVHIRPVPRDASDLVASNGDDLDDRPQVDADRVEPKYTSAS